MEAMGDSCSFILESHKENWRSSFSRILSVAWIGGVLVIRLRWCRHVAHKGDADWIKCCTVL